VALAGRPASRTVARVSFPEEHPSAAVLRPLSEVAPLRLSRASVRFTAPGSITNGEFGLFRYDLPAGPGGASPHLHRTFSESFYVLEGTVTLFDGTRWVEATAGDFIYIPRGGVHAFRNDSGADASMLILFAPGAPRETYFRELADIAAGGRTLSRAEWVALWARYDQYPAEE
jgi:mannose-6-phosphate isomerase-like protein (cupin superfamily)